MTRKPLAIDLCCGLGGWTSGLLAEGWEVVGIDIEEHVYGEHRYPAALIIQDVLTVSGYAFSDASLIVASPPCQFFSYCAMPWSRAKALAAEVRADPARLEKELAIFYACFRIQREASQAAGRHIPMIVENVRGAIPWVGRSRWNYGSFHIWGDVPALMPATLGREVLKHGVAHRQDGVTNFHGRKNQEVGGGSWFAIGGPGQTSVGGNPDGRKVAGFRFDGSGRSFQSASVAETEGRKHGGDWFSDPTCPSRQGGQTKRPAEGRKGAGAGAGAEWFDQNLCQLSSKTPARKFASAMIAKIPEPLSRHIARTFYPRELAERVA